MPIIKFVKEKKEVEVPEGTNLRRAALEAGVKLYDGLNGVGATLNEVFNCHGLGTCGTCRVLITRGMENTNKMGLCEKLKFQLPVPDPMPALAYIGNEDKMRLACCTRVNGDIDVETKPPVNLFGESFFK